MSTPAEEFIQRRAIELLTKMSAAENDAKMIAEIAQQACYTQAKLEWLEKWIGHYAGLSN